MSRPSFFASKPSLSQAALKRVALGLTSSPAALVAYLFVANPEALGAPALKLGLMALAGCSLLVVGELSDALVRALGADEQQLTAAPSSTRFG
jgi:hypothetical protein